MAPERPANRRRVSHSLEAVVDAAVALLDESGEAALTFRALAARLGGGVGSIYWYVSNKDELLDRATDRVLTGVLTQIQSVDDTEGPIDNIRTIAVTLFAAIAERPWLAAYFLRNTTIQANGLVFYERLGEEVMRLNLSPRRTFHTVSAVLGYVIGVAADLGQDPPAEVLDGSVPAEDYLRTIADQWRALDPTDFPFMHYIVDEFDGHEDIDQFRAGLELLLDGIRLEAGLSR
ncbi:TetR/AcrR family transcriptional regulator [Gordonia soli]|uniref:Putative TetR family transcriptional regulator n=1 Tax=Gordonia soli NBRC 108243 TaxID=1223545 RepID=M0QKG3_9ACTN|nr:TetR/AcrR family transcriptional regulator [Gordonia soli]GAC67902.1 putative TetR family transcriptional regulator [Gordonia soli NBRC 108243]